MKFQTIAAVVIGGVASHFVIKWVERQNFQYQVAAAQREQNQPDIYDSLRDVPRPPQSGNSGFGFFEDYAYETST